MFKTVEDLKAFLEWAKEQGIQSVKAKGVEVHFAPWSLPLSDGLKEIANGDATLTDTEPVDKKEDEDALFWSSRL